MRREREKEPPRGAPWDEPIDGAPFAFVDLEMTGLDAEKDRVCEACVVRTKGRVVEETLETLVKPDARIGGNAAIHVLDAEKLASAPSFLAVAPEIERLLRGAILVAHGATWDLAFLRAELERAGRPLEIAGWLDTLTLARRSFARPSHRLATLCTELGIALERPHRAGDDARAAMELFFRVVDLLAPVTPRDLWHVRIGEKHARPEILAEAMAAAEAGTTVAVRYRPASRGPEEIRMVITDVRTDLDPPRVLGYLQPGRGRKELRADRILAILPSEP